MNRSDRPAISVENVSKRFRLHQERRTSIKEMLIRGRSSHVDFWALRDVSFEVERGETFGLIGHNGSGKSTMLKMLAGIYQPTSGLVRANGRVSALLELGAGFHGELTGRENIYLNGAILGLTRRQIDRSIDKIIDFAGIEQFIDSPVKFYSSGMYVRLGFSIAVTVDPEILIVDEVIAVGDEEFQRKCFDHLYELRRNGTTIVLVSHSLGLVADICSRAIWLDHGQPRAIGPSQGVIDQYLHEVNAAEVGTSDRVEQPAADLIDGVQRRGSGQVIVERIEYLDGAGQVVPFLTSGEPGAVRLHYLAADDTEGVTFGVGFVHESGVTVSAPNSGVGGMFVPRGSGTVDLVLDSVLFNPGTFRVSTSATNAGHTYDSLDKAFELKVRSESAVIEGGLTRLHGRWQLTPSDVRIAV